jgi:hypothetical protein
MEKTDDWELLKVFMDKFESINKTHKIMGLSISYLRTNIFRNLVVYHQSELSRRNIDDIYVTLHKSKNKEFGEMILELHDSGYFQDPHWKKVFNIIK